MKQSLAFILAPLVVAIPLDSLELDPELAGRRANIIERRPNLGERQASISIDSQFKNRGKGYIGVATDRGLLEADTNAAIIQADFGQVTPENSMKWGSLNPSEGQYNWDDADYLVNFAVENGKVIRGHTLIWHSQLPDWVANIDNADTLREAIRNHVSTVVGRYKGQIRAWDVVNEIFNEDGTLRDSVFSRLLGEEFVSIAFNVARETDPSCVLYLNDYNLDQSGYSKVNGVQYYVNKWISEGVPIDAIGSQTHLGEGAGSAVEGALQQLASTAVTEVAVTELDIANAPAGDYEAVVQGCLNTSKCYGITVWGVSDKNSWRTGENPLLFDYNMNQKAAYDAVASLLG